jgi:hypothetical protein
VISWDMTEKSRVCEYVGFVVEFLGELEELEDVVEKTECSEGAYSLSE